MASKQTIVSRVIYWYSMGISYYRYEGHSLLSLCQLSSVLATGAEDNFKAHWETYANLGKQKVALPAYRLIVEGEKVHKFYLLDEDMNGLPEDFLAFDDLQWEGLFSWRDIKLATVGGRFRSKWETPNRSHQIPVNRLMHNAETVTDLSSRHEVSVFRGFFSVEYVFRGRRRALWHNAGTGRSFIVESR